MGCGYSKQTPEGGKVHIKLQTFHQVRLQEMRKCRDPAILQGDGTEKMSLYESAKKEYSISSSQFNDHVIRHERFKASAKVVGAKTDARVLMEKTFNVVPVAYSDNETRKKPARNEDEMQINKATRGPHEKDGYVTIKLEMIEDEEDADRLSKVKSPTANEGEPAKETLDDTVKTFAADSTKRQPQEVKGSNANEQQKFKRKDDYDNGDDDDDRDSGRRISQTDGDLSSGPPSFRVYCVPPSQEIEEEEEGSGDDGIQVKDDSDGLPALQRRISRDSFGSILSVSSWSSNKVVETNVKERRRKQKFGRTCCYEKLTHLRGKKLLTLAPDRHEQKPNYGCWSSPLSH